MKKSICLSIVCFVSLIKCHAQQLWLQVENTPRQEKVTDVLELDGGNFIFSVNKDSTEELKFFKSKSVLIKTDAVGNILLKKTLMLGSDSFLVTQKLIQNGNKIIALGFKDIDTSKLVALGQLFYCELDSNLNVLKDTQYVAIATNHRFTYAAFFEGDNSTILVSATTHPDTNFIASHFFGKALVLVLNTDGSVRHSLQYDDDFYPLGVLSRPNNQGFIITTNDQLNNPTPNVIGNYFILDNSFNFIDTIPILIGANPINGSSANRFIMPSSINSFLMSSYSSGSIYNNANSIGLLQRFTISDSTPAVFDTIAQHTAQDDFHNIGSEYGNVSIANPNSIYFGVNNYTTVNSNNTINYIAIQNIDSNLVPRWQKYYGGDANYRIARLVALNDGNCMVLAMRNDISTPTISEDLYIFKIDSTGMPLANKNIEKDLKPLITVYPNPSNSGIINIQNHTSTNYDFQLFDLSGKMLMQKANIKSQNANLNLSNNAKGVYLYKLLFKDQVLSGKLSLNY